MERCFDECVSGFRSKKMTSGEKECVQKCATKFTTFTQRVASRFQELQIKMNQVSAMVVLNVTEPHTFLFVLYTCMPAVFNTKWSPNVDALFDCRSNKGCDC